MTHAAMSMMSSRHARPTTGLAITGRFNLDTEFGKSAYRNTKGPQSVRSERRLRDAQLHQKTAAGHELTDLELIEVPTVARGGQ
jgi:hypothetical protein